MMTKSNANLLFTRFLKLTSEIKLTLKRVFLLYIVLQALKFIVVFILIILYVSLFKDGNLIFFKLNLFSK